MSKGLGYLYAALAWAFVAGVILQIFLAGLGLLPDRSGDHGALQGV
jgi:hypothetical protein